MSSETLIYIIIAGIIALLLALFQYWYKSKIKSKLNVLLSFLRFVSVFSILLLLINPKFDKTTYYNEKPSLIVAVDNSESVSYLKQDEKTRQLLANLKSDVNLNNKFNLDIYTFGKKVESSDSLTFKEKQSNPDMLFERLSQVYKNTNSPTIFITDGNQTYGNDYEFVTNKFKQPVFPIILGDTIQYIDVKIQQLNVNKYAYLNNQFPVEIIATYSGNNSVNTQLKVTSGNNATVFSQNLNFSKQNTSQIISFTLPANRVGVSSYKAEIVPIENEKNIVNNAKNFAVEVIDQKTNVALISDITHPDLGALKKSIESNEQRQASILKPNEYLLKSNDFQLVILYQPNNSFSLVFDEIEKLKLNKFTVLGTKTSFAV